MNASKSGLGSSLARIDAHIITPEEYAEIPELTDAWFASADLHEGGRLIRRGRPVALDTSHTQDGGLPVRRNEAVRDGLPLPVAV